MSISTLDSPNHVLSLILFIGRNGEAYANQLHREGFPRPTVYDTLEYLQSRGILIAELRGGNDRGGLRRIYYLSPLGKQVYEQLDTIDSLLRDAVQKRTRE